MLFIAGIAAVCLTVFAVIDCAMTDHRRARGIPKLLWVLVILVLPIIGALLCTNTMNNSRVLGVTRVTPNNGYIRVRGIASSGRYAYNNYSPYGVGAYGALGYGYQQSADLSFKCDVDYRGYVRDIDINRR